MFFISPPGEKADPAPRPHSTKLTARPPCAPSTPATFARFVGSRVSTTATHPSLPHDANKAPPSPLLLFIVDSSLITSSTSGVFHRTHRTTPRCRSSYSRTCASNLAPGGFEPPTFAPRTASSGKLHCEQNIVIL